MTNAIYGMLFFGHQIKIHMDNIGLVQAKSVPGDPNVPLINSHRLLMEWQTVQLNTDPTMTSDMND